MTYLWHADLTHFNKDWLKLTMRNKLTDIGRQEKDAELNSNRQCLTYTELHQKHQLAASSLPKLIR